MIDDNAISPRICVTIFDFFDRDGASADKYGDDDGPLSPPLLRL